ncbi:MAG: hypothetical protein K0R67_3123 [Paenibacillus sp.]|jgi:hypothetical protein|nr:hypothetical protein [Paenibacillus sp.]
MNISSVILWIILLFFPVMALYWRRYAAFSIYILGCAAYLYSTWRNSDGWEDLADFATLLVIVIPLYILACLVWVFTLWMERRRKSK